MKTWLKFGISTTIIGDIIFYLTQAYYVYNSVSTGPVSPTVQLLELAIFTFIPVSAILFGIGSVIGYIFKRFVKV